MKKLVACINIRYLLNASFKKIEELNYASPGTQKKSNAVNVIICPIQQVICQKEIMHVQYIDNIEGVDEHNQQEDEQNLHCQIFNENFKESTELNKGIL